MINQIKNDIHILNIITCGEIKNDEERIDQIKTRLQERYIKTKEPPNKKRKTTENNRSEKSISEIMDELFNKAIFNTDNHSVNLKN